MQLTDPKYVFFFTFLGKLYQNYEYLLQFWDLALAYPTSNDIRSLVLHGQFCVVNITGMFLQRCWCRCHYCCWCKNPLISPDFFFFFSTKKLLNSAGMILTKLFLLSITCIDHTDLELAFIPIPIICRPMQPCTRFTSFLIARYHSFIVYLLWKSVLVSFGIAQQSVQ